MLERPAGPQQRLVGLDRRAGLRASQLRGGLREHREPEAVQRGSEALPVAHLTRDHQRPLRALESGGQRRHVGRRRHGAAPAHGLAGGSNRNRHLARRRDKGFAKWKVDVDGPAAARFRHRPGCDAPPQTSRVGQLDRRARVEEPPDRRAVEPLLVDRLIGSRALQLRRPVSCEDDQRCTRVGGFDHRRVELGRRRSRRAQEHHRLARRLRQADAEERARALVDVHEHPDLGVALECHRERSRPRPRRHAGVLDALSGQLVHEGCGERLRYIHSIQWQ